MTAIVFAVMCFMFAAGFIARDFAVYTKEDEMEGLLENPQYDPNAFIDWLRQMYGVKNDSQLANRLEQSPALFSKIRHKRQAVGAVLLIQVHEDLEMPIAKIKTKMFKP